MALRVALLMVAVAGLSACGTTSSTTTSSGEPEVVAPTTTTASAALDTKAPLVVRGPVVPDDPEPVVTPRKRVNTASVAPSVEPEASPAVVEEPSSEVSKPVTSAKPEKAPVAPPVKTADAAELPKPTEPLSTDAAPTPSDTAPSSTPAVVESAPTSPAPSATKPSLFSNPGAFMQATIGGFPIWLAGLIGLVLLVALAVAFGGRRKQTEVV